MVRVIVRRAGVFRRQPPREAPSFTLGWDDDIDADADVEAGSDVDVELALVLEMRDVAAAQRRLRRAVLSMPGERVRVRCRLHMLPAEHEDALRLALTAADDRLAVLRHCDHTADQRFAELLADAARERVVLAAQFDDVVLDLDVTVGLPPRGGRDWSLADVPAAVVDEVNRAWAALRADLVRAVEHLVASDLVRVVSTAGDGADVAVVGHGAEAMAQVRAFADEVRRVQRLEHRCTERLRRIALRAAHADPRSWLAENHVRSRQAREALDMVRAVHAALAEVDALARPEITAR